MADSQPSRKSSLSFLLWIPLGLLVLFFMLPSLLTCWPPASVERRTQRQRLTERVQLAGGWDVIRRGCIVLAEQNTNGFYSNWHDPNLPPAIVALRPIFVQYEPTPGRVSMRIFGIHSTPYFGLEVVTRKAESYKPGEGYGIGVIGNYHSTFREVAEGIYEIY
jgi:hypothetical protein